MHDTYYAPLILLVLMKITSRVREDIHFAVSVNVLSLYVTPSWAQTVS